jgi:phosphohistidine phosphatase SixA
MEGRGWILVSTLTRATSTLEAVGEKVGPVEKQGQVVRRLAGWLSHGEANALRKAVEVFDNRE